MAVIAIIAQGLMGAGVGRRLHESGAEIRTLLTGYADKENAIKAINNVGLYQYIEKPWDNEDLKLVIRNGLEKTILLQQLEEKIREVARAQHELSEVQKDILRVFA